MDFNNINWSDIWRDGVIFFAGEADKTTSWDNAAERWNTTQKKGNYSEKVLETIVINPDWTTLDVGCGTGLLAIPIAKKCKHVTALDISSQMLKYLKQNAEQEKVTNITCINRPFEETVIGKDVERHDIVIASRSMGWAKNLERFLRGVDEAAKRRAYVISGANGRTFDIGLYKTIGRPYGETRKYIIIYNLLYQMGIRANIQMVEHQQTGMSYKSVEDACFELGKRFERKGNAHKLNKEEEAKLGKYLKKTLQKTSDGTLRFIDNKPIHQAAIMWWDKNTE